MEANNPFTEQVRLLVALLPSVAKQACFALKGGTTIYLFLRDMPRLSVDIDLAYLPVEDAQPGAHEPVQTSAGCSQTRKNLSKIKTG